MTPAHAAYAVPASALLAAYRAAGIGWIVTVPDIVQMSVHVRLAQPDSGFRTLTCAAENQALEVAAGLYAGGARAAILVQNQGLFNCLNALRTIGLDGRVPLFIAAGQFGREFDNLGADPRASRRRMVSLVEPVLDAMQVPWTRLERPADLPAVPAAIDAAFSRSGPSVLLIGHYTAWE